MRKDINKYKERYDGDILKKEEFIYEHNEKAIYERNFFKKVSSNMKFNITLKMINIKFQLRNRIYLNHVKKTAKKTLTLSSDSLLKKAASKFLNAIVLLIVGIIILCPFYWMIITSFKTYPEVAPGIDQTIWPKVWSLQAYKDTLKVVKNMADLNDLNISRFFINSVVVALLSTLLQLFVSLLGGFAIYNWKTRFNSVFLIIIFSIMMVPGEALLMGRFVLISRMGWANTGLALIVPFIGNVFTIYLVANAFSALGSDLRKASKIDGLSNFQYFFKIATPAISATLVTAFITGLITSWNSILWPITIIDQNGTWTTIPMLLYKFLNITGQEVGNNAPNDPINVKMAACLICILPMIVLFVVFNRPIINGLTKRNSGGNKG
ncbi:carbohydrate ABC transporter permease [Mesoplasma melaleucae]|uniref:sn-glycerol-3-phosphate ABC transporter permease n=1 Tax=Mesoplasma melaleucae TaxID=81459 RepID=A0A2K8NV26_9MOLU|nr:carbohydrate ABC transporter permease [Mesoplasma melaleucae]ATZ17627.1 sn-glycerol-3-phosphate ABC transporter permease [Mesoplasma melaleucae]